MTTLPPLSPVANNSPEWLNSTVEIISAAKEQKQSPEINYSCKYSMVKKAAIIDKTIHFISHTLKL